MDKYDNYGELLSGVTALIEDDDDIISAMANTAAAIYNGVSGLNWVGFYRVKGDVLVLGPFQGKIACTRIARGRGVCGAALSAGESLLVPDVHAFPGHIACDSASNSEAVVPVRGCEGDIVAVLDIDSPILDRFAKTDLKFFESVAELFKKF